MSADCYRWFLVRPNGDLSLFSANTRLAAETLARTMGLHRIVLCAVTADPFSVIDVSL